MEDGPEGRHPDRVQRIATGVVLGVARVMGETAPLLILVSYAVGINFSPTADTMGALPTMINTGRDQARSCPGTSGSGRLHAP